MEDLFHVDRRTTLTWLSSALAGAGVTLLPSPSFAADAQPTAAQPAAPGAPVGGYGNDPDLMNPSAPWPKTMSQQQLQISGALADLILPPTATSPAPSAVGIPDFVDEWVSAPYPDQRRDRALIMPGLLWLDTEAQRRWRNSFTQTTPANKRQLLVEIAAPPTTADQAAAMRYGFFRRFRTIAVGAYFSLERNFAELGYVGNNPLETFPSATPEELAHINGTIARLGL